MSAQIWLDIQSVVKRTKPELSKEFELCRDKEAICTFLNKHFPLEGKVNPPDWSLHHIAKLLKELK